MAVRKDSIDKGFLGIVTLLLVVGLVILTSASSAFSEKKLGSPYEFLWRQLLLGVGAGMVFFLIALRIPIRLLKKGAPLILLLAIGLVALVFMPALGGKVKGAHRWIYIGSYSFQPSEVLKFAYIVYLAAWMSARRKQLESFSQGFLPFLVLTIIAGFLILLEPDLGTLGVMTITGLALFMFGGGQPAHMLVAAILGLLLVGAVSISGYRQDRLSVFIDYWRGKDINTLEEGYQFNQGLIAIGSGGFFGKGLGLSRQKFQYLPEAHNDAIFAIVAEELGFVGVIGLFVGFIVFCLRGMMIASRAKDSFSAFLAAGLTLLIVVQVCVNIAALSGLVPITGVPLPFLSYGGSALAILLFEMGVLFNISRTRLV